MDRGLIEYGLVGSKGKLHESLLRTEAQPRHLHIAMLLLGAKGASSPDVGHAADQSPWIDSPALKNSPKLSGDAISIRVEWKTNGKEKRCRAEDWIFNKQNGAPMPRGNWIYTGSAVIQGTFIAQRDQSMVAIISDPFALINYPGRGRDDDEIWQVHSAAVPPAGTAVRVIIKLE